MKYRQLLKESSLRLQQHNDYIGSPLSAGIFTSGARWMHDRLNENAAIPTPFNESVNFNFYGLLKYGICIVVMLAAAVYFYRFHIFFLPLSVLLFYFCEVQFLFLFPLLIDDVANPVWSSIRQTWRIGIWTAMTVVIPVSIFMMLGLFHTKTPLRNWYIGSLAIIIWYQYEVRDRVQ